MHRNVMFFLLASLYLCTFRNVHVLSTMQHDCEELDSRVTSVPSRMVLSWCTTHPHRSPTAFFCALLCLLVHTQTFLNET